MKSNLNFSQLDNASSMVEEIHKWISDRSNPEKYLSVESLEDIRDFVHTLDLLETVLVHFEICTHLTKLAIKELEDPLRKESFGWEFLQIDIEEFFATNFLEMCYQISNAWKEIEKFFPKNQAFVILSGKYQKPSETLLARHKTTHFNPNDFEKHQIAQKYSILRRPYHINNGKLEKELAKHTLPKVATLVKDSITESYNYIQLFRAATLGN